MHFLVQILNGVQQLVVKYLRLIQTTIEVILCCKRNNFFVSVFLKGIEGKAPTEGILCCWSVSAKFVCFCVFERNCSRSDMKIFFYL